MANLKKKIKLIKILSTVLVILLGLCVVKLVLKENNNQESVVTSASYQKIVKTIKQEHFVSVTNTSDVELYTYKDGKFKKEGTLKSDSKVNLKAIKHDYLQLSDSKYYLKGRALKKIKAFKNDNSYTRWSAYNDDVEVKSPKLYDQNDKLKYHLDNTYKFEVILKDTNTVSVVFNSELLKIKNSDITSTLSGVRSNTYAEKVPVFMFHFFYDQSKGESGTDGNWTEISQFRADLKAANEHSYQSLRMSDLNLWMDGKINLRPGSFIISMDDNNESVKRLAYPALEEAKVYGTNFVVTSWGENFKTNLASDYVEMQSHSDNLHVGGCSEGHGGAFLCDSLADGIKDVKTSSQKLGGANVFCYPFGDYNDHTISVLKQAGYQMAFTTQYGYVTKDLNKYILPRIRMSAGYGPDYFIGILAG